MHEFHKAYYNSQVWNKTFWRGVKALKCPLDLWIYQEIISAIRPDYIIETGTADGGSALFMADVCELINHGEVITIDIEDRKRPAHPRIFYITGSSINPEIIHDIKKIVENKKTMVILDSNHTKDHVLKEMTLYSQLVSSVSYLIVEDTNLNGHPVMPDFGPGPMEAVDEFLKNNDNFLIDYNCHKFAMTFNYRGYLIKT